MDVHLLAEFEWPCDYENIVADFNKLLKARAKHRQMIFQAKSDESVEDMIDKLIALIKLCKQVQSGDRSLLVGMNYYDSWDFKNRLHIQS